MSTTSVLVSALTLLAVLMVLLLFVVSGVYKFRDPDGYVAVLRARTGGSESLCRALIVCAGLLQVVAPLLVAALHVSAAFVLPHPWLRALAVLGCVGLTLFTLIATYLFKVPKFRPEKPWPLLSNVSVAGGLVLLARQTAAA